MKRMLIVVTIVVALLAVAATYFLPENRMAERRVPEARSSD
jgi:hypothetical protein